MNIHLRFYRERYNMDDQYYTGNEDVYRRIRLEDLDDIKRCWNALIHDYEGETYSAWLHNGEFLCGGAFDPGDIDYIEENYATMTQKGRKKQ